MNNTDDILKRILLNMKYDPKKSLNENINEDSIDEPLEDVIYVEDVDYYGNKLYLPETAKINYRIKKSDYQSVITDINAAQKHFNSFKVNCEKLKPNDVSQCVLSGVKTFIDRVVEGGVGGFTVNELNYTPCYKTTTNNVPINPINVTIYGYVGKIPGETPKPGNTQCSGKLWLNTKPTEVKKKETKPSVSGGDKYGQGKKEGWGDESSMSLDLDL